MKTNLTNEYTSFLNSIKTEVCGSLPNNLDGHTIDTLKEIRTTLTEFMDLQMHMIFLLDDLIDDDDDTEFPDIYLVDDEDDFDQDQD